MEPIPYKDVVYPKTDIGICRALEIAHQTGGRDRLRSAHKFDKDLVQKSLDCPSERGFVEIVEDIIGSDFDKDYQRGAKLLELVMINDLLFGHPLWKSRDYVLDKVDEGAWKG